MMNIVRKASTLSSTTSPTSRLLAKALGPDSSVVAVDRQFYPKFGAPDPNALPVDPEDHDDPRHGEFEVPTPPHPVTNASLRKGLLSGLLPSASRLLSGTQVRHYHPSKHPVPDFEPYRKEWGKNLSPQENTADKKPTLAYLVNGVALATTLVCAKYCVRSAVGTLAPQPAALALASIEIDLNGIPEGKSASFKWRGKPIFVRHRTAAEINREREVPISELRDPQADQDRVTHAQWLVVIGVCTHLGCVPIANAGEYGGYYCPCHGSHYDASGRIRKGPAPANLEVPSHEFKEGGLLVIG